MNEAKHKDAFRSLIWQLAEDFGRKCTEAMVTSYWSALHDLEWDDFERAVSRIGRDSQTFPRPIDIRRQADDGPQETDGEERAKRERAQLDREIDEWAKDRPRVERDRVRFRRLMDHIGARVSADGVRACPNGPDCEGCRHERAHPRAHLHLRNGGLTADVDWHVAVAGCCAREGAPR